ncbi:MAG: peptide-methionine (S)-S-oxide reductase MsrA [Chloroherpetonaceae bacterium]|nr:peptide-methionine (S)-S-oxide reductase MsrA [Chloroherpetonaceae bacterium]
MKAIVLIISVFAMMVGCTSNQQKLPQEQESKLIQTATLTGETMSSKDLQTAIFANGCFWCTEAVFQRLDGVEKVESGYIGGKKLNPTYDEVCSGQTGHAEACRILFDPSKISYKELLEVFWQTHDPTTLNRQGNDVGTQYRSGVFYLNESQKKDAEEVLKLAQDWWNNKVVTEITEASTFYVAENYHQNYFNRVGAGNSYCIFVINPKIEKFKKQFKHRLKAGVE